MDTTPSQATPPTTNNGTAQHVPEFMKPYFRLLKSYKAPLADDEVDKKVIKILSAFADYKPEPSNPTISITDS